MKHPLTKTEKYKFYPRMIMKLKQTGKIHIIKPPSIKGFTQHAARENWYILNHDTEMWEDWEYEDKTKLNLKLNPNFEKYQPTEEDREEEIREMKESITGMEGDR